LYCGLVVKLIHFGLSDNELNFKITRPQSKPICGCGTSEIVPVCQPCSLDYFDDVVAINHEDTADFKVPP